MSDDRKAFISYLDDNDHKVEGFFVIIDQNSTYVRFRSGKNIITIPFHRIMKVKHNYNQKGGVKNGK